MKKKTALIIGAVITACGTFGAIIVSIWICAYFGQNGSTDWIAQATGGSAAVLAIAGIAAVIAFAAMADSCSGESK